MRLSALDIVVIIAYMAMMSLIGVYFSRRTTTRDEFFLGGRGMHWILVGGSLSLFSTISFMALPGEMIRYGLGFFTAYLITPLVIPVVTRVVLPNLLGLHITSAYEYLEKRFGPRVTRLSVYAFILKTILWMAVIIYTASLAVSEVTGWSIFLVITIIGIVTTFYTSAGGLRSVIWTDFIQTLLFTGCALIIPIYVGFSTGSGPLTWWGSFAQAGRTEITTFSLDPTVRVTVIGNMASVFFYFICTNASDQMAVQRFLSTPSVKAARRSVWVFCISTLLAIFFLMVCGLSLFAFYRQRSTLTNQDFQQQLATQADRMMPQFIVQELPHGISGLIVAGLLAAAMSGLSSGMSAITSVIISGFQRRLGDFKIFNRALLLERLIGVMVGAVGISLAVGITFAMRRTDWNLVELSGRLVNLFVGPLAVLFFSGMLLRRARATSVVLGFIVSTSASMLISFSKPLFGLSQGISFTWVIPGSLISGFVTTALISYFFNALPKLPAHTQGHDGAELTERSHGPTQD